MAQRVEISLVDDLDGSAAAETIIFAIDGCDYEIDLSSKNASKMRADIDRWKNSARKTAQARRRRSSKIDLGPSPRALRAWANDNGYELSSRGRVPETIRVAYVEKHAAAK